MKIVILIALLLIVSNANAQPPTGGAGTQTSPPMYSLTVTKSGAGTGTITGAGPINCGSVCSASYVSSVTTRLTATADSGSTFAGWSGSCSGTGTCVVPMTSAKSVAATFDVSVVSGPIRYAGPSGGGSTPCTTDSAPYCDVSTVLSVLQCGDTLLMKNGTYQGSNQMLVVGPGTTPSASACTSSTRVTVRAQTEGSVLIDGQHVRAPVYLSNISYWDLIGLNARYGGPAEAGSIFSIRNGAHHIRFYRVIGWDAGDGNDQVFLSSDADNILYEDVAGFGSANQICMGDYTSTNVTMRRMWCRGEGSTAGRGVTVNQFNYYGNSVNPNPALIENTIQTNAPAAGLRGGQIEWLTDFNRDDALNPGVRYLGGIHYLMSEVHIVTSPTTKIIGNGYKGNEACTGYVIQDTILHANGFASQPLSFVPGTHNGCHGGTSGQIEQITRLTTVTSGGDTSGTGNATLTNFIEQTTLGATGFNYIGASNTARLCYRYVDGSSTSTPLWPWPMDERIKAAIAMNTTANGAHVSSSVPLAGTSGTGYTANTVTSEIASVFGAIPTSCNGSALFRQRTGPHVVGLIFMLLASAAVLHQRRLNRAI